MKEKVEVEVELKVEVEGTTRVWTDDGYDDVATWLGRLKIKCLLYNRPLHKRDATQRHIRTEDSKPFRSPYCCTSGAQFLIVSSRTFLHASFDWHSALLPRLLLLLRYFLILVEVSEISWGIGRQYVKNGTKTEKKRKKIKVNTHKNVKEKPQRRRTKTEKTNKEKCTVGIARLLRYHKHTWNILKMLCSTQVFMRGLISLE